MDLAHPKPSATKNVVVALICLAGMGVCGDLLRRDITSPRGVEGPSVATVTECGKNVRRKPATSYLWGRLTSGSPLFRRDSVKVGAESYARLRLSSGAELELGENSLVVLDESQALALQYLRGSIIVREGGVDREISVDNDGRRQVRSLAARLMEPQPEAVLAARAQETVPLVFRWRLAAQPATDGDVTVQVALDRGFSRMVTTVPSPSRTEAGTALAPGVYYWRVASAGGPLSESRRFRVVPVEPLRPIWPDGNVLSIWDPQTRIAFRWVATTIDAGEGQHAIELSPDATFASVSRTEVIEPAVGAAHLTGLTPGEWFWRLRSQYGETRLTSGSNRLRIEQAKQLEVELLTPSEGSVIEREPQLRFAWNLPHGEAAFRLEVRAEGGSAPLTAFDTGSFSYAWQQPQPGVYEWRVLALRDGNVVGGAPWRRFSIFAGKPIELKAPTDGQELLFWKEPPEVELTWAKEESLTGEKYSYRVTVAKDMALRETVISTKVSDNELELKSGTLPTGDQFWRVELLDDTGKIVKTSRVGRFYHGPPPALPAPVVSGPPDGATFNVVERGNEPELGWNEVDSAQAYLVTVLKDGKPVLERTAKTLSLRMEGLRAGQYEWTVRAVDPLNRPGQASPPSKFVVAYGKRLKAPQATEWEVE